MERRWKHRGWLTGDHNSDILELDAPLLHAIMARRSSDLPLTFRRAASDPPTSPTSRCERAHARARAGALPTIIKMMMMMTISASISVSLFLSLSLSEGAPRGFFRQTFVSKPSGCLEGQGNSGGISWILKVWLEFQNHSGWEVLPP